MKRLDWIDNLRIKVIIMVVILHAAVTYSGLGGWYYKENQGLDKASTIFFAFYLTFAQAYFMSLLFMISGYFTRISFEKKGTSKFVTGRLKRLGIPLLIYIFLLHPISVKLVYPDMDLFPWYFRGIKNFDFVSWTGPMWFVEALLIFSLFYVYLFRPLSKFAPKISLKPTNIHVVILIVIITIVAFVARLFYPLGTDITNLQIGFFSAYVFLFALGVLLYQSRFFEEITFHDGKKWLLVSLGLGIPAWLLIIFFGGPVDGIMLIEGGLNWPAFFYALWESFFCVTFIIALVGIFKYKMNISGKFQKFLSDNAFGVFVFHAPVLIGISMLLKEWSFHPILKFLLVSLLAVTTSFGVAWLVRQVPIFRKIFS